MTQRNVEIVIGRLVSDEELRAAFRRNRQEAIGLILSQGLELSPVEIGAIGALDPADLDRLASKLDPRVRKASLKRTGACFLLVGLLGAAGERPAAAAALTLEEAVGAALANNRQVRNAALQIQRDDASVADTKAKRYPQMSIQALGGQTLTDVSITVPGGSLGSYPVTGPIPATDTKITSPSDRSAFIVASIAQPLTQLHAVSLGVRMNEQARELDREDLRARRASVVADVKRAYFGILRTESALASAEEQLSFLRETKRVVDEMLARESVLRSQVMDVDASLAGQEARILSLRDEAASTREQLNDLMGRDLATAFDVAPLPEAPLG
jgi:outer membrane protein TolC